MKFNINLNRLASENTEDIQIENQLNVTSSMQGNIPTQTVELEFKNNRDVHVVDTCKDLESIGRGENYPGATHINSWDLNDEYKLEHNINCLGTKQENTEPEMSYGSNGFDSIGSQENPFTGIFDGQGYEIQNIYMHGIGNTSTGIFSTVDSGDIRNLTITTDNTSEYYTQGNQNTGLLAGEILNSQISNINISGVVKGYDNSGLVAGNIQNSNIKNIVAQGNIEGRNNIGGIAGTSTSDIYEATYEGILSGENNIGGIVGEQILGGDVSASSSRGVYQGNNSIGGIVGNNNGIIESAYSEAIVNGIDNIGGITGVSTINGEIQNTYSTGGVVGENNVGGLIGYNLGNVTTSYSISNITGTLNVGGLVGINIGRTTNSISLGDVTPNFVDESKIGGVIGYNSGTITNLYTINTAQIGQELINQETTVGEGLGIDEITVAAKENYMDSKFYENEIQFGNYWDYTDVGVGQMPKLFKVDENGVVLNELLENQINIGIPNF